jgi:hypothetical protein
MATERRRRRDHHLSGVIVPFRSSLVRPGRAAAVAFIAAVLAAAPGRVVAQADSVLPRALVTAFVRGYALSDSGETPEFTVAAIPSALQPDIALAPRTSVLGTVGLRRNSFVLATSTLPPDSLLRWTAHAYTSQGWTANALIRVTSQNPSAGGFRPAPPAVPTTFCKDGRQIDVNASHGPDGFTNVRYRVAASSPICTLAASVPRPPAPRPVPASVLPLLREPPNSMAGVQCYGAAAGSQRAQSMITSSMEPSALLAFYREQMVKQGWTPVEPPPAVTRGAWTRRDSTGVAHMATIVIGVSPTAPSCRDESIEVTTPRS